MYIRAITDEIPIRIKHTREMIIETAEFIDYRSFDIDHEFYERTSTKVCKHDHDRNRNKEMFSSSD